MAGRAKPKEWLTPGEPVDGRDRGELKHRLGYVDARMTSSRTRVRFPAPPPSFLGYFATFAPPRPWLPSGCHWTSRPARRACAPRIRPSREPSAVVLLVRSAAGAPRMPFPARWASSCQSSPVQERRGSFSRSSPCFILITRPGVPQLTARMSQNRQVQHGHILAKARPLWCIARVKISSR